MDTVLYVAQPRLDYSSFLLWTILLILSLLFLYFLWKRKIKTNAHFRQLGFLLGGLLSLIFLFTAFFSAWDLYRTQPITLYDKHMESYYGTTSYKDIKRAGIFKDKGQSLINPSMVIRESNILMIEKRDKSVLMFSEEHYEIDTLVRRLNARL